MTLSEILATNLLSPVVLAFVLGVVATLVRSDLKIPDPLYQGLAIYLLLAIGLKGGVALSVTPIAQVSGPLLATLVLGVLTPFVAFVAFRSLGRFDAVNSGALAAHFGSVSAVTFLAALAFAEASDVPTEGFLPALVAILEVPGIGIGLILARRRSQRGTRNADASMGAAIHEVLTGRSILLLIGGIGIGWAAGPERMEPVNPFFTAIFPGVLALFLLEMGLVAARRLRDLRDSGVWLVVLSILIPLVNGALGVWAGSMAGLSEGGAAVLGTMAGSASYIAAPAAVRVALPEARPGLYLTAALGVTFPFNLVFGIPIYFALARFFGG
jgi:hypothetical protein